MCTPYFFFSHVGQRKEQGETRFFPTSHILRATEPQPRSFLRALRDWCRRSRGKNAPCFISLSFAVKKRKTVFPHDLNPSQSSGELQSVEREKRKICQDEDLAVVGCVGGLRGLRSGRFLRQRRRSSLAAARGATDRGGNSEYHSVKNYQE